MCMYKGIRIPCMFIIMFITLWNKHNRTCVHVCIDDWLEIIIICGSIWLSFTLILYNYYETTLALYKQHYV